MTSRNQGTFSREEERGPWERGWYLTRRKLFWCAAIIDVKEVITDVEKSCFDLPPYITDAEKTLLVSREYSQIRSGTYASLLCEQNARQLSVVYNLVF